MYADHGSSTAERSLWEQRLRVHDAEAALLKSGRNADAHTFNRHTKTKSEKKFSDPKRVKACSRSHGGGLLISADDRQRIALWRYPAVEGAKCRLFAGHGTMASGVHFSAEDRFVVSVGGDDCSAMVWRHFSEPDEDEVAERKALAAQARVMALQLTNEAPSPKSPSQEEAWALLEDDYDQANEVRLEVTMDDLEQETDAGTESNGDALAATAAATVVARLETAATDPEDAAAEDQQDAVPMQAQEEKAAANYDTGGAGSDAVNNEDAAPETGVAAAAVAEEMPPVAEKVPSKVPTKVDEAEAAPAVEAAPANPATVMLEEGPSVENPEEART